MSEEEKHDPKLTQEGELWRALLMKQIDLDKARDDAWAIFNDPEKFKEWLRITAGYISIECVKYGKTPLYYDGLSFVAQVWQKQKCFTKEYEKN